MDQHYLNIPNGPLKNEYDIFLCVNSW